jgi:hypothetical protein
VATIAIEINDAGLTLAAAGKILAVEPGYALVDGKRIVTGSPAHAAARLRPRYVSNRYWANLSLEPGSAGIAGVQNTAELAYAQLRDLWTRFKSASADALLVVPGFYDKTTLGILLGLAQECGVPVRGMLDAAAAASARPYPGRQLVYVDASLHRMSVTRLSQDRDVTALEERSLATTGLASLNDLFAKRIAEVFVLATRFDPFHHASSEQALYDSLPKWLEQLRAAPKAELVLAFGDEEFRVDVERGQLLAVAAGIYKALLQLVAQAREAGSALAVELSDRLARQPGLAEELARLDDAIVAPHPPGHAALMALAALPALGTGDQVKLLRRIAWRGEPIEVSAAATAPAPSAAAAAPAVRPTHVVYRGIAYPVNGGLLIGRAKVDERRMIVVDEASSGISRSHCELALSGGEIVVRDLSSYGTYVNEKRVSGEEVVHPADVIRIGSPGAELTLVRVEQ